MYLLEKLPGTPNFFTPNTSGLQLLRRLPGGSQALLVQDREGGRWVLKLNGNPQGNNVLANEWLGSALGQYVGLPMPPSAEMYVPESFFDDERAWFQLGSRRRRPQAGMHFASRFFPDLNPRDVLHNLPSGFLKEGGNRSAVLGMLIFDVWANHLDFRQMLFSSPATSLNPTCCLFIDNGHLFGGPEWDIRLSPVRTRMSREQQWILSTCNWDLICSWIHSFQCDLPEILEDLILRLPGEWYVGDKQQLYRSLTQRLIDLPTIIEQQIWLQAS